MAEPQEQILGLAEDRAAGTLAPNAGIQLRATQDEFTEHKSSTEDSSIRVFLKNILIFSFLKNFKKFPNSLLTLP